MLGPLASRGSDSGDVIGIKSNLGELFLLGLLRAHDVHSGISTRVFYPNFLKLLSVLLGSFYGVESIISHSLTKPGASGFFSKALSAAPKSFTNYLVN